MGSVASSGYKFDIYSRVIAPQLAKRVISPPNDIFRYELAPVPTSIFDEFGDKRINKSRSQLKKSYIVIPTYLACLSLMSVGFVGCVSSRFSFFHKCEKANCGYNFFSKLSTAFLRESKKEDLWWLIQIFFNRSI